MDCGQEILGLEALHKFMCVKHIAGMFEKMTGNFTYFGDFHMFLNMLNGTVVFHIKDERIVHYVTATEINAAPNLKKPVALMMLIIALQFDVPTSRNEKIKIVPANWHCFFIATG